MNYIVSAREEVVYRSHSLRIQLPKPIIIFQADNFAQVQQS